jgi:hypothetical protein
MKLKIAARAALEDRSDSALIRRAIRAYLATAETQKESA